MAFAVIPLRLAPFANPWHWSERFAFDLRLGSTTVTGPGIRCFLRALTPAVHPGCEMEAVTLYRVAPAPFASVLPVDNEDIGENPCIEPV
jgi:hypothetical protein